MNSPGYRFGLENKLGSRTSCRARHLVEKQRATIRPRRDSPRRFPILRDVGVDDLRTGLLHTLVTSRP
jgi:hypothetical protein